MKSLAELRDEFNTTCTSMSSTDTAKNAKTSAGNISKPTGIAKSDFNAKSTSTTKFDPVVNKTILRMKAETAAELYLNSGDDTGLFLRFLDFYVAVKEFLMESDTDFSDEKMVKVFHLFAGDAKKSSDFLIIAGELEELGFEEESVVSALMLHSNDRESALDYLMKN